MCVELVFRVGAIPALERASARRQAPARPKPLNGYSYLCPNCANRFQSQHHATLYCGIQCRSEPEAVRYTRKKVDKYPDGWPEDIEYAVGIQIAHALSGGYDKEGRRLPASVRALVIERDRGNVNYVVGQVSTSTTSVDHHLI